MDLITLLGLLMYFFESLSLFLPLFWMTEPSVLSIFDPLSPGSLLFFSLGREEDLSTGSVIKRSTFSSRGIEFWSKGM